MNVFSEIEGLDGEDLITAILRILLLRSQEVRERFVGLLAQASHLDGPIEVQSHFSCLLQQTTQDNPTADDKGASRWGRLDLLIETDDTVVGVENKLFAAFQPDQPQKYLETVKAWAKGLGNLRHRQLRHQVAVIAPRSRSQDVKSRIGASHDFFFLDWETVLETLKKIDRGMDDTTRVILESFTQFLGDKIEFVPKFGGWVPYLRRWSEYGTPLQHRVIRELQEFFPEGGRRLSNGESWLGYYCCNMAGWFGYVSSKDQIDDGAQHEAELIVVTSFPVAFSQSDFRILTLRNKTFLGKQRSQHAWAIKYDQDWSDPQRWRMALEPLGVGLQKSLEGQMPTLN